MHSSRRLRQIGLTAVVAAALVVIGGSATPVAIGNNPGVMPPWSHPHGRSYGEWSAQWWQSLVSTPVQDFPSDCETDRIGRVSMVLPSPGGAVTVDCTIPPHTSLFIPVFTAALWCPSDCGTPESFSPNSRFTELDDAIRGLIDLIDPDTQLRVEVDGKPIWNLGDYRAHAPRFSGVIHVDSFYGFLGPGRIKPMAAGGYYVMLKPLARGPHQIHVYADMLDVLGVDFDTTINVTVRR